MKRDLGTSDGFIRRRSALLDLAKAKSLTLPATLKNWDDFRNAGKTKDQHLAELEAYLETNS